MRIHILLELIAIPITLGIVLTWLWAKRRERGTIAMRLARITALPAAINSPPLTLIKRQEWSATGSLQKLISDLPQLSELDVNLVEAGLEQYRPSLFFLIPTLFLLPPLLAFAFGFSVLLGLVAGCVLVLLPFLFIKAMASARRNKFCEQLPDAIDLMVAVLRSGHSMSQAVRSVALEIPSPCGREFEFVLQRMNLGQALSDALLLSSKRFRSYELDLMRRAVAIQVEVGGSLADILEKTNLTLRQRLQLARQLKAITAQSRLSAWIVGLLPIVLGISLNIMNPGYLQLLVQDPTGRGLLAVSLVLEVLGIIIMRRMSTLKVT
jgi:tight adherence protein B